MGGRMHSNDERRVYEDLYAERAKVIEAAQSAERAQVARLEAERNERLNKTLDQFQAACCDRGCGRGCVLNATAYTDAYKQAKGLGIIEQRKRAREKAQNNRRRGW